MMWKFLRGGATVIPGATFIPESRVIFEGGMSKYLQFLTGGGWGSGKGQEYPYVS